MRKTSLTNKLPGYKAPAIQKTFHLLRTVAESREPLSLTDLALQLGYSKSTTHGMVHALLREGALVQGPDGHKLFLGATIVDLAFSGWNYLKIVKSVQPLIDALRDQVQETVVLGALIGKHILIMAAAEAAGPFRISASPGTVLPLFAGAAGKVLHAAKTDAEVVSWIREKGLPRHTSRSIMDEARYLAELEQVRANGYSIDREEYLDGVCAVAVALHNLIGPPIAVWAVGMSGSMIPQKTEKSIAILTGAAQALRSKLDDTAG